MNQQTMVRRGFVPYGPAGAGVEALSRVMAADLAGSPVTVNVLLPGGATRQGWSRTTSPAELRARLLDPAVMGPPIVWLASPAAAGVHDERIVADGVRGVASSALSSSAMFAGSSRSWRQVMRTTR